jgi:hypothetical protein
MGAPQCTDDDGEGKDETDEEGKSSCRHLSASSWGKTWRREKSSLRENTSRLLFLPDCSLDLCNIPHSCCRLEDNMKYMGF